MSKIKPIAPPPIVVDDIAKTKERLALQQAQLAVPEFVIAITNDMVAEAYNSATRTAEIMLHVLRENVRKYLNNQSAEPVDDLFEIDVPSEWLDFEPLYREAGWKCIFHKAPFYMENASFFTFKAPTK